MAKKSLGNQKDPALVSNLSAGHFFIIIIQ